MWREVDPESSLAGQPKQNKEFSGQWKTMMTQSKKVEGNRGQQQMSWSAFTYRSMGAHTHTVTCIQVPHPRYTHKHNKLPPPQHINAGRGRMDSSWKELPFFGFSVFESWCLGELTWHTTYCSHSHTGVLWVSGQGCRYHSYPEATPQGRKHWYQLETLNLSNDDWTPSSCLLLLPASTCLIRSENKQKPTEKPPNNNKKPLKIGVVGKKRILCNGERKENTSFNFLILV